MNLGELKTTWKPLEGATVRVIVTRGFRLRVLAALLLVRLAIWIGGGELEVRESNG